MVTIPTLRAPIEPHSVDELDQRRRQLLKLHLLSKNANRTRRSPRAGIQRCLRCLGLETRSSNMGASGGEGGRSMKADPAPSHQQKLYQSSNVHTYYLVFITECSRRVAERAERPNAYPKSIQQCRKNVQRLENIICENSTSLADKTCRSQAAN